MTNTKFRRRALISSVAMLLVALVALGSATFAWFTDNPKANAEGITGKGQTSQGLQVKTDSDSTYGYNVEFFKGATKALTLDPAYRNASGAMLTAKAASATAPEVATTDNKWATVDRVIYSDLLSTGANKAGYYYEAAYVKAVGTATDIDLVVSIDTSTKSQTMTDAVCVAVVVGGQLKGTYKVANSRAIVKYSTAAAEADVVAGSGTDAVQAFGTTISNIGNAPTTDAGLKVEFYVYIDGSDSTVTTSQANAADLFDSITATFSKHV